MSCSGRSEEVKYTGACENADESPETSELDMLTSVMKFFSDKNLRPDALLIVAMGAICWAEVALRVGGGNTAHPQTQEVCGFVQDAGDANAVSLATISASNATAPATSDSNGEFCIRIVLTDSGGATELRVLKKGYVTATVTVRLIPPVSSGVPILLSKAAGTASVLPKMSTEMSGSAIRQGNCIPLNVGKKSSSDEGRIGGTYPPACSASTVRP